MYNILNDIILYIIIIHNIIHTCTIVHIIIIIHVLLFKQDALRVAPQTYSQLLGTLLPRLQPNPEMKGATVEEQQDLVNSSLIN